jgi:hypothetical protein
MDDCWDESADAWIVDLGEHGGCTWRFGLEPQLGASPARPLHGRLARPSLVLSIFAEPMAADGTDPDTAERLPGAVLLRDGVAEARLTSGDHFAAHPTNE